MKDLVIVIGIAALFVALTLWVDHLLFKKRQRLETAWLQWRQRQKRDAEFKENNDFIYRMVQNTGNKEPKK